MAFPDFTLFGREGIHPGDIRQGAIGNCWFISAASAVSEIPGRLEKVFLNNSNGLSKNGIYGVNIYTLGMPHTILVDDYLPLAADRYSDNTSYRTLFSHVGKDKSVWGSILEKAFAKYHGNYDHL